jgi:hypothetical protein
MRWERYPNENKNASRMVWPNTPACIPGAFPEESASAAFSAPRVPQASYLPQVFLETIPQAADT